MLPTDCLMITQSFAAVQREFRWIVEDKYYRDLNLVLCVMYTQSAPMLFKRCKYLLN